MDKGAAVQKNGAISTEELKFVYRLILNDSSDEDILREYTRLGGSGQLDFPVRTGNDFVRKRRAELEAASEVLSDRIEKMLEPLTSKRKEEHFQELAKISEILLQDNLSTVSKNEQLNNNTDAGYIINDNYGYPKKVTRWQLRQLLTRNIGAACQQYTVEIFYQAYIPHYKAVFPGMDRGGFWPEVEKRPYEVITGIKQLVSPGAFRGKCPLCMEMALSPLLSPKKCSLASLINRNTLLSSS